MTEGLTDLEASWLKHYLDTLKEGEPNTTEAARRAGCKCGSSSGFKRRGSQLKKAVFQKGGADRIEKWKGKQGLSEEVLKSKLFDLLNAKETKFFQKDGKVLETKEVEALGIQIKALDMGMKMKGMYAPEKKDLKFSVDEEQQAVVGFFSKVMGVTDADSGGN